MSGASLSVIGDIAAAADELQGKASIEFPLTRILVIVPIIILMALLFAWLFKWQQQIEQSGYFGKIFQDTITDIETVRLTSPITKNWAESRYLDEIFLRRSQRGEQWVADNPPPAIPDHLMEYVIALGRENIVYEIQRLMEISPTPYGSPMTQGGTSNPFRTGLPVTGYGGRLGSVTGSLPGLQSETDSSNLSQEQRNEQIKQYQKKQQEFEQLLHEFSTKARAWVCHAGTRAWAWYQKDITEKMKEAHDQATQALRVDFSALRGRGPEFVLEFTALVVIIFAAVILGIVEILSGEQIGTLLAAIAGYVLGKGTSRSRSGPGEEHAMVRPAKTDEGKNQAGPPSNTGASGELHKNRR
ncbi:MAG: hypothetical protein NDI90_17175 [Nitrospira sp. BO4]|nr:hypothetical protein [Nitrospira sp. BO4]